MRIAINIYEIKNMILFSFNGSYRKKRMGRDESPAVIAEHSPTYLEAFESYLMSSKLA